MNVAACTNPPIAGVAISSSLNVCPGTNFTLNLTGNSTGLGQTYLWESSANGLSGWTAISSAQTSTSFSTAQSVTTYYRSSVQCNSGTAVQSTVIMITTPLAISGTFTINSNVATSGTNFQTFADALGYINCGIGGPVTFNVVPGSGPYSQKITIPQISGTSSSNRIIFNGNGAKIEYTAPDATNRTAITLDGADFVTLDSFVVDVSGSTFSGWGIVLMNQADSNLITRCNILNNAASTSTNYCGILINGSNTAIAVSGNNGNGNTFSYNSVSGGSYGFYLYGNTTNTTQNIGNKILNNVVKDFYTFSIYGGYQSNGLVISKNNISRPARANSGTCAGVYLIAGCLGALVEKNRIHNMFDGFLAGTSIFYGVFINADGKTGLENKVINNVVYNINGNGPAYGIYNSGADSMLIYHNTIVLDDAAVTTGAAYGFYQTTLATGINFSNNIISVTRSGTGIKRCIHLNTNTSNVRSNKNVLYLNSTGGTNNNVGQFGTITYPTLTNWKTANSNAYDSLSVDKDPQFTGTVSENYLPSIIECDNIGNNYNVADDILELPRNATPDPGAFEFVGPVPVTLINFNGEKAGEQNKLFWNTLTEVNNVGFELQRSANGVDFTKINFVTSKAENGVSNATISYVVIDTKPLTSTNYYRLKQVDKDGKFTLSNIVVIAGNKTNKFEIVNLYPNPVLNSFNLTINSVKDENIKLVITDVVGKVLLQENRFAKKGENNFSINVNTLAKGNYTIKAICANGCETAIMKFSK